MGCVTGFNIWLLCTSLVLWKLVGFGCDLHVYGLLWLALIRVFPCYGYGFGSLLFGVTLWLLTCWVTCWFCSVELTVWVLLSLVGFFVICGAQCSCYGLWGATCLGCLSLYLGLFIGITCYSFYMNSVLCA